MYYRRAYIEEAVLPSRLGYEVAGVVEAVGHGVDPSWLGKRVSTIPATSMNQYGVLGEETLFPVSFLAEYPPNLSPIQGTSIWMQYLTAYGALVHVGNLAKDDFVIITAASSSVGLAAIEIARAEGAIAIAATRTAAKRDELLSFGAHHVIVTEEEDLVARVAQITGGKGARIVFDPVCGPFVEKLALATGSGGIIFQYGALSPEPTPFPLSPAIAKNLAIRGYRVTEVIHDPAALQTAKKYIYDRLVDGRFLPKIAKVFSFAQTVEAYQYLESNAQMGKVVITMEGT